LVSALVITRPTRQRSPSAELGGVARKDEEAGAVHCQLQEKDEKNAIGFTCGAGSSCCGDTCMEPGGTCCKGVGGDSFACGPHSSCCGDACVAKDGTCCNNSLGDDFPCSKGGQCCGNTCAPPRNRCCTNSHGTKYAVSHASPCIDELKNCTNGRGDLFYCGTGAECCGDGCMAPGAVCCLNKAGFEAFSCGQFSSCCGNTCAAPGSRCCVDKWGSNYPVAAHPGGYEYPWETKLYENCSAAPTGAAPKEAAPEDTSSDGA